MLSVRVELNIDDITQAVRQQISDAISQTAMQGMASWINSIQKAKLSPYDKAEYSASINMTKLSDFKAELFSDYRFAKEIETGRPARDLKKNLHTSQRTRVAKSGPHAGQRYLLIPFRHNTSGNTALAQAMPKPIYLHAKALSLSHVTGMGTRLSGSGAQLAQRQYQWGTSLPAGLAPKLKTHHTTDIYAGMKRFNTSAGQGKSSAYLTFRVMGEWQSNKWIIPPQPGLFIAKELSEQLQTILDEALSGIA
ncbi:MAG: hypothetical protein ACOYM1_09440 [Methylovulum sp.]